MRTGVGYRSPASSRSARVVVLSTTSSSCSRNALRSSSRPVWGSSLLGSRSGSVGSGPSNVGVPISHLLHSFDTHPCPKTGPSSTAAQLIVRLRRDWPEQGVRQGCTYAVGLHRLVLNRTEY